ncbi:MAG: hypothetical protein AAGA96_18190 [Verrucomicrobiota bacterium]
MKTKCTFLITLIVSISWPLEALNLGYLPGDTSFRVSYSKEKWQDLLKLPDSDPIELDFFYSSGVLCGVAGQWTLKFESRPELLDQALRKVISDDRFWKVTGAGKYIMDGPVFFFVSPEFDLTKHSLMRRDNPNYRDLVQKYPDGRHWIEQHPNLYEESRMKLIQTDNAPAFGALPPFPLEQESFGKEYAPEVVVPKVFKIIVVADAADTMIEDAKDWPEGASTIAFSFTADGREEFSYAGGEWTRTQTRTEQAQALNP